MSCESCTGTCQTRGLLAALTQVSLVMEQVSNSLADRNIRLAMLEERVDALSQLLENRVLNKETPQ